jgi:hypothetical protein
MHDLSQSGMTLGEMTVWRLDSRHFLTRCGKWCLYQTQPALLAGGFFFGMLTEIVLFVAQKSYERVY